MEDYGANGRIMSGSVVHRSALGIAAVEARSISMVRSLLMFGADVDEEYDRTSPLLLESIANGDVEIVHRLVGDGSTLSQTSGQLFG